MPMVLPDNLPPIAAIDIGSNSLHLIIAKLDKRGNFTILDADKAVLRLGEALTADKTFTREAMERTIATIRHMKEIAAAYQPIYRAVATHATRIARNHQELFQAIYAETGIAVALIDGLEEARLVSLGMQHGLPLDRKSFLGIDIGGGSTEIIICNQENIDYVNSLHLGSVILSQRYLKEKKIKKSHIEDLEKEIALALAPLSTEIAKHQFDCAVVCSGAAKTIAAIHALEYGDEKLSDPNGYQINSKELGAIHAKMQGLRTPQRIADHWNLEANRAEIILAGTSILTLLTRFFGVKKWLISSYGLREGLVIDTISRLQSFTAYNPMINDVRWKNILHLGERYQIDLPQAQRVTKLALTLYDQLPFGKTSFTLNQAEVHLSDREILRAAAWLHECGKFINLARYHRHSFYLIVHSCLMGYSERERYLIGLVARYQRKGRAQKKSDECRELQSRDLQRINYLASILRLAVAAHRSRQGVLTHIDVRLEDKQALFMVESKEAGAAAVDLAKLAQKKAALEEILDRPIRLQLIG